MRARWYKTGTIFIELVKKPRKSRRTPIPFKAEIRVRFPSGLPVLFWCRVAWHVSGRALASCCTLAAHESWKSVRAPDSGPGGFDPAIHPLSRPAVGHHPGVGNCDPGSVICALVSCEDPIRPFFFRARASQATCHPRPVLEDPQPGLSVRLSGNSGHHPLYRSPAMALGFCTCGAAPALSHPQRGKSAAREIWRHLFGIQIQDLVLEV